MFPQPFLPPDGFSFLLLPLEKSLLFRVSGRSGLFGCNSVVKMDALESEESSHSSCITCTSYLTSEHMFS